MTAVAFERHQPAQRPGKIHWLPAVRVKEPDTSCHRRQFSADRRFVIEDHRTARKGDEFFVAKLLLTANWFEVLASTKSRQAALTACHAACQTQGGTRRGGAA